MKKQPVVKEKVAKVVKKQKPLKIAILSYGSLIQKGAKLIKGKWSNKHAPQLPLEVCRVTAKGKLVLAVNEDCGVKNSVYFATAKSGDLNKVLGDFIKIEKIGMGQVGCLDLPAKQASPKANKQKKLSHEIALWAKAHGYNGVVYNLLGRRFKDILNIPFTVQAALDYVNTLEGKTKKAQVDYLKSVPDSIQSPVLDLLKGKK